MTTKPEAKYDYAEPWELVGGKFFCKTGAPIGEALFYTEGPEFDGPYSWKKKHYNDAERIVACVNACAGIPDSGAAIKAARETIAEAIRYADFYGNGVPVKWRNALALLGEPHGK